MHRRSGQISWLDWTAKKEATQKALDARDGSSSLLHQPDRQELPLTVFPIGLQPGKHCKTVKITTG